MNKVITLIVYFLWMLSATSSYAQHAEVEKSVTSMFKLNFFLPGISYEQKIAQYQTVHFLAYTDLFTNSQSTSSGTQTNFYFTPSMAVEIRNYYNLNKRERKGKMTAMNSGNYLAPLYIGRYSYRNDFGDDFWINEVGAVWGLQRTSPSGFSFDLNLGLAYAFASKYPSYTNAIEPILQIALGFRIGGR